MSRRVGVIHDCGRRYFRTSVEAFPQTAEYACAIERVRRDNGDLPVLWTCAVLALCLAGMSWAGWLV